MKINCDKNPKIPYDGWTIESHKKMGKIEWNPDNIELYLSDKQKTGHISGNELRKELENKPVLNACVLDYLLKHQDLIPDSWKGKNVYFWGTIFRSAHGNLCVRYLYWDDGRWNWHCHWLDNDWDAYEPAALLASNSSGTKTLGSDLTLGNLALRVCELEAKMGKIEQIIKI